MRQQLWWEAEYSASRRKHHHRCQGCRSIIQTGERVLMHRIPKGTRALHLRCEKLQSFDGLTCGELFKLHAAEAH